MGTMKFVMKPGSGPTNGFTLEAVEKAITVKVKCAWKADEDKLLDTAWEAIVAAAKKAGSVRLENGTQVNGMDKKLEKAQKSGSLSSITKPGDHDLVFQMRGESDTHRAKISIVAPREVPADDESWKDRVDYANPGIRRLCEADKKIMAKIKSITLDPGYTGHGPTTALGAKVLHAHVTNQDGIAFRWDGDNLMVVAWGSKWDAAPDGNSGYKWTT